ncbi:kinase-like protein, partial [Ramaria rubella]
LDDNIFVKRPGLMNYDPNNSLSVLSHLEREINMLEILSKNPHKNIVKYLGVLIEDDRVVGICLEKCKISLKDCIKQKVKIHKNKLLNDIESGIRHMHSLGYIHDDINPNNIMIDNFGDTKIIDFDSSKKISHPRRGKSGTEGWTNDSDIALEENDFFSLQKVK